jgi:hypothetical protein
VERVLPGTFKQQLQSKVLENLLRSRWTVRDRRTQPTVSSQRSASFTRTSARPCARLHTVSHVRRRYAPICTDAQKHAIVAILKDQSSIQGVRFRIRKLFWADRDFFAGLDDWIFGTFDRWLNVTNLTPKLGMTVSRIRK